MPKSPRASPAERRSWRNAAQTRQASSGGLRQKRAVVTGCGTLLFALLVVALAYWLWPAPQLQIASLVIDDHDSLAAPPIAFAGEDQQALEEFAGYPFSSYLSLNRHQQAGDFATLAGELAKLGVARDVAVVYVAAHGISRDGAAVLVCSDYEPQSRRGQYPLSELIASLAQCPAKTCLLVLDAGRLQTDAASGLLVNEFPRLVEAELAKPGASPNLWVLLSNSLLEKSLVSPADKRSVFNYFFCEGLRGDADAEGNRNEQVELHEFANYLKRHVGSWASQSSGGLLSQTPLLLRGGQGVVTDVPELYLARRQPPRPETKPADSARHVRPSFGRHGLGALAIAGHGLGNSLAWAAQEPAPGAPAGAPAAAGAAAPPASNSAPVGEPAAGPPAPQQPVQAPPAALSPAPATPAATSGGATDSAAPLQDPMRRRLHAERLRAERASLRSQPDDWIPADFAPHLWRAHGEFLADGDARLDAGRNFSSPSAMPRTDWRIGQLQDLWQRMEQREREFSDPTRGLAKASYNRNAGVRSAVQVRNQLLNRLPRYIAYYTSPSVHAAAANFGSDLRDVLAELRTLGDLLTQEIANPAGEPNETKLQNWLAQITSVGSRLASLRNSLDGYLASEAQELVRRASKTGVPRPADAVRLEDLLRSELLSSADREQVTAARLRLIKPLDKVSPSPTPASPRSAWLRVADRADLELQMLRLAEASDVEPLNSTGPIASSGGTRVPPRPPTTDEDVAAQCTTYARLGVELGARLARLSAEIGENSSSSNFVVLRQAETQLRLTDGRDAMRIDDLLLTPPRINPVAELALPLRAPKPSLVLALRVPSIAAGEPPRLELAEPHKLQPLTFAIHGTPRLPRGLQARLHFDSKALEVFEAGEKPLVSGKPFALRPATSEFDTELPLQVKALAASGTQSQLKLELEGGNLSDESIVEVQLPRPTGIKLTIDGRPLTWSPQGSTNLPNATQAVLRPFPNPSVEGKPKGATHYALEVRDSGGRGRKLKYELKALPLSFGDRPWTTRYPWDANQRLPDDCVTIVAEQDLEIPAGGSTPLPFVPTPPAANPAAPAPPPPVPAATPPTTEPGRPIGGGLVAIFTDPVSRERELIWIDVEVLHPADYLREPSVAYDAEQQRIDISITPQEADSIPSTGTEINWFFPRTFQGSRSPSARIDADRSTAPAKLHAMVQPQRDLVVPIFFDVDGYPRAFIYEVPCWNSMVGIARKVLYLRELKIEQPEDHAMFVALETLPVQLQLDIPRRKEFAGRFVCRAGLNGDLTKTFYHDRRRQVWLLPPTEPGQILLQTAVGDLQTSFNSSGFMNDEVTISAELWNTDALGNDEEIAARDTRTVILDSVRPEISPAGSASFRFRGVQDQPLAIRLRAIDTASKIAKLEVSFAQENGVLKEPVLARRIGGDEYEAILPTKEKTPGEYDLYAQATDHVKNSSPIVQMLVRIDAPPPPAPGSNVPASKNNQIRGSVVVGSTGAGGITVTLLPKNLQTKSRSDGTFEFTNVPPGAYKLQAEGTFKNVVYSGGPVDVTVDPAPAEAAQAPPISLK